MQGGAHHCDCCRTATGSPPCCLKRIPLSVKLTIIIMQHVVHAGVLHRVRLPGSGAPQFPGVRGAATRPTQARTGKTRCVATARRVPKHRALLHSQLQLHH